MILHVIILVPTFALFVSKFVVFFFVLICCDFFAYCYFSAYIIFICVQI